MFGGSRPASESSVSKGKKNVSGAARYLEFDANEDAAKFEPISKQGQAQESFLRYTEGGPNNLDIPHSPRNKLVS